MKKYMGNKKEVLLFYLLMIAVIGWFVVAETVYPSERIKVSGPENLTYLSLIHISEPTRRS